MTARLTVLTSSDVRRNPLRYLFAMSRRAKLAKTFTLGRNFVDNSVLLGLSSRSRKRVFVKYTKNVSSITRFACGRIRIPTKCFFFGMRIGKLGKKRSNNSVRLKQNGTGGVLGHFLAHVTAERSLCLYRVGNNGLHGTVPHRTCTVYTIPRSTGRSIHARLGVFADRMRGRLSIARPSLQLILRSRAPHGATVSRSAATHLLGTLCTTPRNICTVDRSVPKLMRASAGLTSIGVGPGGIVHVRADRHDSVLSTHSSVTGAIHSTFRLTKTGIAFNRNCPN